ncbi:MAG: hypothetical protein JW915_14640 [Chitinispirillaceae bacterium]|nr:hypothetical protein [Chitinispirillaceae bacterium]MBN2769744.1 hypothetical protein [Spirochaetota bacterium]
MKRSLAMDILEKAPKRFHKWNYSRLLGTVLLLTGILTFAIFVIEFLSSDTVTIIVLMFPMLILYGLTFVFCTMTKKTVADILLTEGKVVYSSEQKKMPIYKVIIWTVMIITGFFASIYLALLVF